MAANTDLTPGTCPQCSGRRVQNVVYRDGTGNRILLPVECGLCNGTGVLPEQAVMRLPTPPAPPAPAAPTTFDLWPFLIPVGLFVLFFLYLWL